MTDNEQLKKSLRENILKLMQSREETQKELQKQIEELYELEIGTKIKGIDIGWKRKGRYRKSNERS